MPEPRQHPDHKDIEKAPPRRDPVAAQRDIDVIPEPGAEAHVPAAPEFGDAAGDIGIIEVFGKAKAEDLPQADGHIAVPGKIEVDVQRVGHSIHPGEQHRGLAALLVDGDELIQHIGQQHLFGKAQHKPLRPRCRLPQAVPPFGKLRFNIGIAHNGPGDELREHGDIGRQIDEIALCPDRPAVNIHHIAEDLEGVKADADGQRHPQQRDRKPGNGIEAFQEKIGVFAVAQQQKAEQDRGGQTKL